MKREAWLLVFIFSITFIFLRPIWQPTSCAAAIVWSDDFNDGDYYNWTVRDGNFTVEGGTLQANASSGESDIYHNSSIARGTWSWSLYCANPNHTAQIFFIHVPLNTSQDLQKYIDAYSIQIDPIEHNFRLLRWYPSETLNWSYEVLYSYESQYALRGWQYIKVQRDQGRFHIIINGTLRMSEYENSYRMSSIFRFTCGPGCAIDNISASDSLDLQLEPADLQFTEDIISLTCDRGGNTTIVLVGVKNYGQEMGGIGFEWGLVPYGIRPNLRIGGVTHVKFNETRYIPVEFDILQECSPGFHIVEFHLWMGPEQGGQIIDTLLFHIYVPGLPFGSFSSYPREALILGFMLQGVIIAIVLLIELNVRKRITHKTKPY